MIAIFADEHVRQESGSGHAAFDRAVGAGACTIVSQLAQASLGRTWRITLKRTGSSSR
jgi:hypothetical protein